jgi:hypothetical protein
VELKHERRDIDLATGGAFDRGVPLVAKQALDVGPNVRGAAWIIEDPFAELERGTMTNVLTVAAGEFSHPGVGSISVESFDDPDHELRLPTETTFFM